MRSLPLALLLIFSGDALHAQSEALPADILQESYSRLPLVKRADLDESGKRSPQFAEPMHAINQYLRDTVAGRRYFELSALVAAREFDQQYE